jgi:hypothetical protein
MIEIEEFELTKTELEEGILRQIFVPFVFDAIANIKFWIWVAMHGRRFQDILFGFRKPPIEVYPRAKNDYYTSYVIQINRKPRLGVEVPMTIILDYEARTNIDASLIWK